MRGLHAGPRAAGWSRRQAAYYRLAATTTRVKGAQWPGERNLPRH